MRYYFEGIKRLFCVPAHCWSAAHFSTKKDIGVETITAMPSSTWIETSDAWMACGQASVIL